MLNRLLGKKKSRPPSGNKPAPSKGGRGAPPPARSKSGSGARKKTPPPSQARSVSLDRKLDILGIFLTAVGLLTLLSLFSSTHSPAVEAWLNFQKQAVGVGRWFLPLGFMLIGLWLILRKFGDRLPKIDPEQYAGAPMLFLALIVTAHFIAAPLPEQLMARETLEAGNGGGVLAALILQALYGAVGQLGTAIVLLGWWVISIVFTAGKSVPEIIEIIRHALRPQAGETRQLSLPFRNRAPEEDEEPLAPVAPPMRPTIAPPSAKGNPPKARNEPETIIAPRQPIADVPLMPAGSAPAAPYEQPLVIGGDQPWELPNIEDILEQGTEGGADDDFDRQRVQIIETTLASFGAPVKVVEINRGPTITQFGVEPDYVEQRGGKKTKVKVGKIAALADDLALALSAQSIRIEAPVPGKGYVGIEVPNVESALVALRDVMESESFLKLRKKSPLAIGLGQDVSGTAIANDLAGMPHLLIAGTTGSGKSVCVNSIIACLLLENTPDELKLVMVDPKRVELTGYNGIPHLLTPVVVDLERVVASLQWITREMDERYRKFAKAGARNIVDYNARVATTGEKKLPYIVVIIDELADLMMLAPDETERIITRLAQLARATGIHLVIATQRPSVDVVTGLIKANFKSRVAFAVASNTDSRVILDQPGAERLLGRGDMLFQAPDAAAPLRMQGVFVSDAEIQKVVRYWKGARGVSEETVSSHLPASDSSSHAPLPEVLTGKPAQKPLWDPTQFPPAEAKPEGEDELLDEAIKAVREMKKASISLLQRRLRIGYTRSARLIDVLEEKGIIGPAESGAKPREVINFGGEVIDPTQSDAPDTRTWTAE